MSSSFQRIKKRLNYLLFLAHATIMSKLLISRLKCKRIYLIHLDIFKFYIKDRNTVSGHYLMAGHFIT